MSTVAVSNTSSDVSAKTLVTTTDSQTLTNKALTAPSMTSPVVATGAVTLTSGQIAFPSSQLASSDANTLDDYEEGTWTPVLGGSGGTSGQTYGTQYGRYVKIGKLVTAFFDITLTAKGTITTNCQIQGLPFASDSGGSVPYIGSVQWITLNTNWVSVVTSLAASASVATLQGTTAAAVSNNTSLTTADITNTTTVRGALTYVASA